MFNRIFPVIEYEETDPLMDFGSLLFFSGLFGVLLSVVLIVVCVYVL